MSMKVHTDLDLLNGGRVVNLLDPSAAQDAATKAYVDANIEGVNWKDSVRAASTANISVAAPGATMDGITLTALDRILLKNQTAGQENGIYIFNGAAVPATRSLDMNTAAEVEAATCTVEEGTTNAGTSWRQTAVNVTLGTTPLVWAAFGSVAPPASESTAGIIEIATQAETDTGTDDAKAITPLKLATWSGRIRKFTQVIGDGSATLFTVTHNFNSRDVIVVVARNATPWDTVLTDVERNGVNSVQIRFNVAPSASQFIVTLMK